jgi:hypothetical protein
MITRVALGVSAAALAWLPMAAERVVPSIAQPIQISVAVVGSPSFYPLVPRGDGPPSTAQSCHAHRAVSSRCGAFRPKTVTLDRRLGRASSVLVRWPKTELASR